MKLIKAFIIFCIVVVFIFVEIFNFNKYKILDVIDYKTVVVDINKNFQTDDGETIVYDELYLPDNIYKEDKFLINYLASEYAQRLLNGKFVQFSPETKRVTLNDEDFVDLMTKSHLVLNSNSPNEEEFKAKLNEEKSKEYVLVNIKSKRYHILNCDTGIKSKKFKLIPKKFLTPDLIPCKSCIDISLPKDDNNSVLNIQKKINVKPMNSINQGEVNIFPIPLNEIKEPMNTCETLACKTLVDEIDSAQEEILFAIYGIHNQDKVVNALINAKERGVKIKWVTDYSQSDKDYYPDTRKLEEILTDVKDDFSDNKTYSSKLMHNKFFIFDSKKVFTGSSNITQTDLTGFNANYAVLINSEEIAKIFKDEFYQMYEGKFHNLKEKKDKNPVTFSDGTVVSVFFSPQDKVISKQLIPLINAAKSKIDISIFYLTHNKLKEALINAHKRGVKIRIINDATNASNQYSIHNELRKEGIKVKTENFAGKNHSKIMLIDDDYSVIGSMNFTSSGESSNDENALIINSFVINKEMTKSFEQTWSQIDDEYLFKDPPAESLQSINSCFDGVDNDFDGKIDMQDEGCRVKR